MAIVYEMDGNWTGIADVDLLLNRARTYEYTPAYERSQIDVDLHASPSIFAVPTPVPPTGLLARVGDFLDTQDEPGFDLADIYQAPKQVLQATQSGLGVAVNTIQAIPDKLVSLPGNVAEGIGSTIGKVGSGFGSGLMAGLGGYFWLLLALVLVGIFVYLKVR